MLGTEEASNMFFSAQSIRQDNGERKSYKKTVHFHVEIAKQTRELDVVPASTRAFVHWMSSFVKAIFYITKQELRKFFCDVMHCHIIYVFSCIRQWVGFSWYVTGPWFVMPNKHRVGRNDFNPVKVLLTSSY